MEVAPADAVVSTDPVEDPASRCALRFTWKIENFSRLDNKKTLLRYSHCWYLSMAHHLSMYLAVGDMENLPYGWSRCAQFSLAIVNQINYEDTVRKYFQLHKFTARESDWGSTTFIPLSELYDPARGYVVDDTCIVEVDVITDFNFREETDYVGLKNQGATCYLNSLLQTLYHIPYFRKAEESFYDLQLDVKGCKDVYASFNKYVEVERLEGDNKYHSGQPHGLQDAKKGVLFNEFPPVLQLQLNRNEFDFMRDTMVKINDRYEFPLHLDLDREDGKYLSPDAIRVGGVHGGHYCAFIRPTLSEQWFKFDDERVTKEDIKWALEEQYGGEEEFPQTNPEFNHTPFKFTKYSNAYMLVYIRESDKDKIVCDVDEKDIAEYLRIMLKKEQEEKDHNKKEKAEAHLYTNIKVARHEDLFEQIGRDIYFYLVDQEKVCSFRILKEMPFNLFKEEVAKEFGVSVQFHRFWFWAKRQNHTYRPYRPLTLQEETQSVVQLREISNKVARNAELELFLEVEIGTELDPIPPPCYKTKENILLFFKLYDPEKEEIRYVGRLIVKGSGKPLEILEKLNEMGTLFASRNLFQLIV
ncbi:hypothetical protein MKW98_016069 [Papaver atlanticum]|uniref:Ubiquitinyl hydrolase 1 n=1 Tax=Papaver atlanticum TaxID=357466 RepID=A0AAD4T2Z7_9MAGN|nr:hypothetical protein MKW98_016069 [Papaver atlanticum]